MDIKTALANLRDRFKVKPYSMGVRSAQITDQEYLVILIRIAELEMIAIQASVHGDNEELRTKARELME